MTFVLLLIIAYIFFNLFVLEFYDNELLEFYDFEFNEIIKSIINVIISIHIKNNLNKCGRKFCHNTEIHFTKTQLTRE
jgi:hypothetical protein